MDERQLIKKAQDGDFAAFSDLVSAEKTKIYNLSLRMTGNTQDAEDIVQETFLKAIDKIGQFRGESSFGTWLFSITLNLARAHLSRNKKADLRPIEEYLPGGGSVDLHEKATVSLFDWKDPHRRLEDDELRGIVNKGLESLPPKYREAFLLRYYEELSIKEIASLINESVAATKSRVLRARLALRDFLSKSFKDIYGEEVSGLY